MSEPSVKYRTPPLEGRGFVGEVPAGPDGLADTGVDGLDRVRRADHLADLDVEGEEGNELGPGVLPEPDDRRVLLAPSFLEPAESLGCGGLVRGRVDRLQRLGDLVPVLAGRVPEAVPQQVKPSRNNMAGIGADRRE